MLSRLLREFLYYLVHLIVNVLVSLKHCYRRFHNKNHCLSQKQVTKTDVLTLLEKVPKLQKSLKHLVVLTNTDVHSTSDLAKLVIWSLIVGVPYVSFYDITGEYLIILLHKMSHYHLLYTTYILYVCVM